MKNLRIILSLAFVAMLCVSLTSVGTSYGAEKSAMAAGAKEAGETLCGVTGECHVDSRVNAYIDVYINGVYRGTIAPFGDIYPYVGDSTYGVTILRAVASDGRTWTRIVSGPMGNVTWTLF